MSESGLKIKWATINEYVGPGKRPFCEGEAVLDANHILCCGFKARTPYKLEILVLCLKTSAIMELSHEINIALKTEESGVEISSCTCSCKAGSGHCKHIAAVLMLLNRSLDLESLSCTDTEQQWGKIKSSTKKMYHPTPLDGACHSKAPINPYLEPEIGDRTDGELDTYFLNVLLESAPSSEAAIHHDRKRMKSSPSAATELQTASNVLEKSNLQPNKSCEEFLMRNPQPEEEPILFSQLVDTLPAKEQDFFMKNVHITNEEAMKLCASTVQQK